MTILLPFTNYTKKYRSNNIHSDDIITIFYDYTFSYVHTLNKHVPMLHILFAYEK